MEDPANGIRAFIALELDDACRRALQSIQDELCRARAQVRWVRPETMHLTLLFLGDIAPDTVPHLTEGMDRIAEEIAPFSLAVSGVGSFGSRNRIRTIWAGIPDPPLPLLGLQSALAAWCRELGIPLEDRSFKPHLTLGRVRGPQNLSTLADALSKVSEQSKATLPVNRVVLMQSILKPAGAEHSLLHAADLIPVE